MFERSLRRGQRQLSAKRGPVMLCTRWFPLVQAKLPSSKPVVKVLRGVSAMHFEELFGRLAPLFNVVRH